MTAESEIRRRIAERGVITFAEFMELALYWPEGGYYTEASGRAGALGDYYTSPMVHPTFGGLIAVQLFQMWLLLGEPGRFTVVEHGCGNLQLGRDVLDFSQRLPANFRRALDYLGVERQSPTGLAREELPFKVVSADEAPIGITGCVLSNELLDAFPVHQVKVEEGELKEIYVVLHGQELTEQLGPVSTPALAQRLRDLDITLEEGQVAEINLGLADWLETVSTSIDSGYVLTIDYGRQAPELYSPEKRMRGTLTTFYHHTQTDTPLRRVGSQDITSQVDFTSLIEEGRRTGLVPMGLTNQGRFLKNLGLDLWQRQLRTLGLPQRQAESNRAGLLDLTRSGGLGDFAVLLQGKGVESGALWGFQADSESMDLVKELDPPLLTERHLDQIKGRHPSTEVETEFELDALWPGGTDS